jgi:hypothetical protein
MGYILIDNNLSSEDIRLFQLNIQKYSPVIMKEQFPC